MIKNKPVIALSTFATLGCLGLLFPAVGASLPEMENFFNVGLSSSGFVSSLVQLGYALFCFFGGILSDFFGKKKILIAGAFIYGISGLLLSVSSSWFLTTVLFFSFGTGSGMIFISSNTLVIELFPKKPGTFLNIHHTFFSLGSLVAPIIVRNLLASGYAWFTIFMILGFIGVTLGIVIAFSRIDIHTGLKTSMNKQRSSGLGTKYLAILKNRKFFQLLIVVFLAIGVQFGLIYLLVSYLVKVRMIEFQTASLVMSAFFALILAGRLSCSYLVSRISPNAVVTSLLLMLIVALTAGWLTEGRVSYIFFALTGLASSGLMPTLISIAGSELQPEIRGAALGLLSMAGGLGGMIVTLTITNMAAYTGFNNSFSLMIVLSIIAAILFIVIVKNFSKSS